MKNLEKGKNYEFKVTYELQGQKIVIGTMKAEISAGGDVSLTTSLIDPYGVITDAQSGEIIDKANVILYYADTERNKLAGIIPNTEVKLPIIDGFKPNDNKNPQISDVFVAYAFMVFPTTDYYIVSTKDEYDKYVSPTISVEYEIVKWDFKMSKKITETITTPPIQTIAAADTTSNKETTSAKTGSSVNTTIWIIGCIMSMAVAVISRRKKKII